MACCPCGAIQKYAVLPPHTVTRADHFGEDMAGPLFSFPDASSARLVGDIACLRARDLPYGPRDLFDGIVGQHLCYPRNTPAGLCLAPERQQRRPVPSPVRPPLASAHASSESTHPKLFYS
ncbi:hypothetical protein MRX96_042510 [Rhipicephalus microplus]